MHLGPQLRAQRGFTLAELLVTISIIAILFAIALPVLTGVTQQSRLDGASHAVNAAIKLARQTAITQNQPTYIVFQDKESTSDASQSYRSYAVFTINTHTDKVDQAAGTFMTDWETLPQGIVFNNVATEDMNNVFIQGKQWNAGFGRYNILRIGTNTYPVIGFKPKGTSRKGWKNDIHLCEGFYSENGKLTATAPQGIRIRIDNTGRSWLTDVLYTGSGEEEALEQ
jgi:prepilin-type N-terminal cleavage/methylation domain-containing protein